MARSRLWVWIWPIAACYPAAAGAFAQEAKLERGTKVVARSPDLVVKDGTEVVAPQSPLDIFRVERAEGERVRIHINADFRGPENNQPFYSCHGYRKAKTMGRFPSHGMGVDSQSMAASRRMGLWLLRSKVTVIRSCWISTVPPVSTKRR